MILKELVSRGVLKEKETPPPVHINAPPKKVTTSKFITAIQRDFDKYHVLR